MYKSTKRRADEIAQLVEENYEVGRQDRCKLWVYRHFVAPKYGISERTFFRCLGRAAQQERAQEATQLYLF